MDATLTPGTAITLVLLFQFKHFLADFCFQTSWMVRNKGTYGHPGGLAHAGMHALFSIPAFLYAPVPAMTVAALVAVESVTHYHIDWTKDRITKDLKTDPSKKLFWIWFGADQFAHQLTYVAFLYYFAL